MLNNFENIIRSWKISLAPNEEQKKLANKRKEICQKCESCKEFNNEILKRIVEYYCDECKCPIGKKIYSVTESCPKNKWSN
jgi:late competence protein required for DNA uptake (superfamily II DNA/RNA helicase)